MTDINQYWTLTSRPSGKASPANFELHSQPLTSLAEGEVRVRTHFVSVDPYMRGRMDDTPSYAPPQPLDQVMQARGVGKVTESRHPGFQMDDAVLGMLGWQLHATVDGDSLTKVSDTDFPLSTYLGCAGMPGITAWYGLNKIIRPRAGETILVSAASGAVGSVVGQLARRAGARVVGIAGGPEKCALVVEEFGFDACIDYKAGNLVADLAAATPGRIDGNFENVGGKILDAVLDRMNSFGRIAVCGLISGYEGNAAPLKNFSSVLRNRLSIQGFIVGEQKADWEKTAPAELVALVASGELKYRESVSHGIESLPQAFLGLMQGSNIGKQLVKVY